MYYNVPPHRLNGPRESRKFYLVEAETISLEIQLANSINLLLSTIETTSEDVTLSGVNITPQSINVHTSFSNAFSTAFS